MILKRSSRLLAHLMVLVWVLADLADKAGLLFGSQETWHLNDAFGAYYGVLMLTLLSPVPTPSKPTMSGKLIGVTVLVIAVVFLLPLALARLSGMAPIRVKFALDLVFAATLPVMMWHVPKHDLELVERRDQGTVISSAAPWTT